MCFSTPKRTQELGNAVMRTQNYICRLLKRKKDGGGGGGGGGVKEEEERSSQPPYKGTCVYSATGRFKRGC